MAITEVIKYEGDNTTFIWKHPSEDFNTTSQLTVHESQEAIFFANGQIVDVFEAGRHTLETQNIPILSKLINIPTDGISAFHAEVYFINKVQQMAIKWGTDSRVMYIDPVYNIPLSVGANGEMALSVENSKKLLLKLVGTESYLSQEKLISFFRAFLMTRVKTYIANVIRDKKINIFELDSRLTEFSDDLKKLLVNDFLDYGLTLNKFLVTTVVKPEEDPQYKKFKDLYFRQYADVAEAELKKKVGIIEQQQKKEQMIIESEGIAAKRKTEGYTYQQERGFDVAQDVARNEGNAGNLAGLGIGMGMMAGTGMAVGNVVNNAIGNALENNNINNNANNNLSNKKFCDNCGAELSIDSEFCDNCGAKVESGYGQCSNCGFKFEKTGKFCPKCGAKRG